MPLALYDASAQNVLVVGPMTNFFNAVHETSSDPSVVAMGPMASLETLSAGFEHTTLLVAGHTGVNATLFKWGDVLLAQSGKRRLHPYKDSFVLSHLGYWVDNGASYYHSTAGCAAFKPS